MCTCAHRELVSPDSCELCTDAAFVGVNDSPYRAVNEAFEPNIRCGTVMHRMLGSNASFTARYGESFAPTHAASTHRNRDLLHDVAVWGELSSMSSTSCTYIHIRYV